MTDADYKLKSILNRKEESPPTEFLPKKERAQLAALEAVAAAVEPQTESEGKLEITRVGYIVMLFGECNYGEFKEICEGLGATDLEKAWSWIEGRKPQKE